MSARRPLLTASAAGTLLCALWFMPSANAAPEPADGGSAERQEQSAETGPAPSDPRPAAETDGDPVLANTGSMNTTPYLLGGAAFLGCGAGLVALAARRARETAR
ncbi:hypothetical protein [Streptomyces sp. TP-A0874]|uniref:hypothetical protein n=1 Tax=Streptomyces sp. TP-A0874 TaxID=549819 RepID=UPI000853CDA7|nr:hypothetical protein [Streptomyces sp. TP-A0874]